MQKKDKKKSPVKQDQKKKDLFDLTPQEFIRFVNRAGEKAKQDQLELLRKYDRMVAGK